MPINPLRLVLAPQSLEDVFMARYERLRGWALHLSAGDSAAAEDLLQEAFVQFTARDPDLDSIQNLDAYLFGLVRILHLSQSRRTRRRAQLLGSALDYNAAILGLRHADPRDQLAVREDLRRVCQYACARKETSKAGSVLLLRFFLGYYPGEIARVTKSTRPAVEERLRVARAEAKAHLRDPTSLKLMTTPDAGVLPACGLDPAESPDAFLIDIRRYIALSKRGECLPDERMKQVYRGDAPVECATLAHLVSCEGCLDAVNRLLGIPPLAERHPVDTVGKDAGSGGDGGGTSSGGGGGAADERLTRGRRRAREVFEHDPGELCVSVNGDHLCSQMVGGGRNEQTLSVERQVEFVEVFSEQGVRMLLLMVGEQPPDGPVRHTARIALSDGRSLGVALELNYPFSTLRVVYEGRLEELNGASEESDTEPGGVTVAPRPADARPSAAGRPARKVEGEPAAATTWGRLAGWLSGGPRWLRPGVVTAILSLLLVGALLFVRTRVGTVSAAELLSRSAVAERAAAGDRAAVIHRTVYLEERDPGSEAPARRQRVEVWHSEARRVTVRHVYDEAGRFRIGERVTGDGERAVLLPDAKPSAAREARPAAGALLAAGAAWRLNPSAIDYLDLTGGAAFAVVEESADTYVVRHAGRVGSGVAEAVLTIRKADLHAVEMRLVHAGDAGRREYRLVEGLFERTPPDRIPPGLFEAGGESLGGGPNAGNEGAEYAPAATAPPTASAELEVEVNYLLHPLGAKPGEQVSVRRTPDDRVRVEALVETAERKREILAALGPVAANPAVRIDVSTVAEALAGRGRRSPEQTTELDVEVRDDARDADAELARGLAGAGEVEGQSREEVARVGEQLLADSRQAVRHAAALRRLTASFPPSAGGNLDAPARKKLRDMIRAHAEGCLRNARAIEQRLAPFSPSAAGRGEGEAMTVASDAELARAAERLSHSTRVSDEALRAAFTLSRRGQSLAPIKSARFWGSLRAAEKLSLSILRAYGQ